MSGRTIGWRVRYHSGELSPLFTDKKRALHHAGDVHVGEECDDVAIVRVVRRPRVESAGVVFHEAGPKIVDARTGCMVASDIVVLKQGHPFGHGNRVRVLSAKKP